LSSTRIFHKFFYQRVLLSGNRLPEGSNRLLVANIVFKLIYKTVIDYHEHVINYQCFKMLDFKFQESQLVIKHFQNILNLCNRLQNTCNRLPEFLSVLIFKFKHKESHLLMCNRLHLDGNRLSVTDFEK